MSAMSSGLRLVRFAAAAMRSLMTARFEAMLMKI
jgi:hypothetical protein